MKTLDSRSKAVPTKPHIHQPNDESNAHLLYEEVLRKLDQVLNSQEYLEKRFTSQEVRQENLEERFSSLERNQAGLEKRFALVEDQVLELRRTVRGSNGERGMVADLAVVQETLKAMKDGVQHRSEKSDDADEEKKYVSFYYLVDKFGAPVVISILLWFLLTALPKLVNSTP